MARACSGSRASMVAWFGASTPRQDNQSRCGLGRTEIIWNLWVLQFDSKVRNRFLLGISFDSRLCHQVVPTNRHLQENATKSFLQSCHFQASTTMSFHKLNISEYLQLNLLAELIIAKTLRICSEYVHFRGFHKRVCFLTCLLHGQGIVELLSPWPGSFQPQDRTANQRCSL